MKEKDRKQNERVADEKYFNNIKWEIPKLERISNIFYAHGACVTGSGGTDGCYTSDTGCP